MQLNSIYCHSTTNGVWVVSGKRSRCTPKTVKASPNQEGGEGSAHLSYEPRVHSLQVQRCLSKFKDSCVLRLLNGQGKVKQTEPMTALIPHSHFVLPEAKYKGWYDNTKLIKQSLLILVSLNNSFCKKGIWLKLEYPNGLVLLLLPEEWKQGYPSSKSK